MLLADAPPWVLWTALAVAVVAGLVLLANWLIPRATPRPLPAVPVTGDARPEAAAAAVPENFMPPPMALAPPGLHDTNDRRINYRRVGNPVLALVMDANLADAPRNAWVIDRSRQGLRLAFEQAVPAGTKLNVRVANAPDSVPWLPIEVRNSQPRDGYHELGCRFPDTPNWETLLLFG